MIGEESANRRLAPERDKQKVAGTIHLPTPAALVWSTLHGAKPYLLQYYNNEAARLTSKKANENGLTRVWVPPPATNCILITGRQVNVPLDRIIEGTEEEIIPVLQNGGRRVE